MEFKQTQLSNGLQVVGEINPSAASLAAGFFVRTGSRDETAEISGVSHFLEHMVFKGTDKRSPFDVNRDFDTMGARYNAFTSEESTVFYGAVVPEFQSPLIDLLGDILRPSLRGEDFDMEKNVILDEIARYEDQPQFKVYEKLMGQFFRGHPLGNNVLGSPESIRALKRDDMQAYFDRRYSAGNVVVAATGNVDFDALVADVEKACGRWKHFDVTRDTPPVRGNTDQTVIADTKMVHENIALMSVAPSSQDDDRYAAQLLAAIIGDSTGSRLYYALIDQAIADQASMSFDGMDQAGAFITFVSARPDRAAEALAITRGVLADFCQSGPSEAELEAAKNKIASGSTLKGEVPMGRLTSVGLGWVYRHEYVPLPEQIERLFQVSTQEVVELARLYDLSAASVLALGPRESL
ncbi:MAG: pitrilysin family protein [Planctomycetaceae bacterium]|nr:insulinase family protein [Planctomycetaceae bacterium]